MFRNLRSKPCGSARRDKAAGGGGESSGTRWVPRTGGQGLLGCNRGELHKLPNAQVCPDDAGKQAHARLFRTSACSDRPVLYWDRCLFGSAAAHLRADLLDEVHHEQGGVAEDVDLGKR